MSCSAMSRRIILSSSLNRMRQGQGIASRLLYPCLATPERRVHLDPVKLADKVKEVKETNPFFDKYRYKIEKVGGSVAELEKSSIPDQPLAQHVTSSKQYPYAESPSLNKIMIVDKIIDKSAEEISTIWKEYHADKDCVSAVIPTDIYVQLQAKALLCPLFVFPLPRDEGFEFMYSQFNGHQFHFTTLLHYQMHQENAPVCLNLCHYTELQESKGIVLMNGEYDIKALKPIEAQFLANQVQLYYASSDQGRFNLVKEFNHQPAKFEYQQVIDQLQNAGIELKKKN